MISGLGGADRIFGGSGDDKLTGGTGKDTLSGGSGADTLSGGASADKLSGGANKDKLIGGLGNDSLTGGTGDDKFVFVSHAGKDKITDFATGHDTIDVHTISAIKSFAGLKHMMHDVKGDVIIKITSTDWITVENHHKSDFHAGDFAI